MEIHLSLFKIPSTVLIYECVNVDCNQPWLGGISSHLQNGLEEVGDSEDMLSWMEALRGKTDSNEKSATIRGSIRRDFLYQ